MAQHAQQGTRRMLYTVYAINTAGDVPVVSARASDCKASDGKESIHFMMPTQLYRFETGQRLRVDFSFVDDADVVLRGTVVGADVDQTTVLTFGGLLMRVSTTHVNKQPDSVVYMSLSKAKRTRRC